VELLGRFATAGDAIAFELLLWNGTASFLPGAANTLGISRTSGMLFGLSHGSSVLNFRYRVDRAGIGNRAALLDPEKGQTHVR
jgi:hypothetical protein